MYQSSFQFECSTSDHTEVGLFCSKNSQTIIVHVSIYDEQWQEYYTTLLAQRWNGSTKRQGKKDILLMLCAIIAPGTTLVL